jgi:hypothetical protein
MGCEQVGPVQQALAQPVLPGGVAARLAAGGDLGHVDHGPNAGLGRRLREDDGRLEQARQDRVAKVGAGDALQGRGHAVEVVQVRHDDLGAGLGQRARAFVLPMHHRPGAVTALEQQFDRAASGPAGCAGDQEQPVIVRDLNTFRRTLS